MAIETKSRYLDWDISIEISRLSRLRFWKCQDFLNCRNWLSASVEIFSTVETGSLPLSRSRVSIETRSRQIKTPMLRNISKKVFKIKIRQVRNFVLQGVDFLAATSSRLNQNLQIDRRKTQFDSLSMIIYFLKTFYCPLLVKNIKIIL